jgi:hypothetical protein
MSSIVFDINMNEIKWDTQAIYDANNGKSVMFEILFSAMGTNDTNTSLCTFGGSVQFMVFKNAPDGPINPNGWYFNNVSSILDLTGQANFRGLQLYTVNTLQSVYAVQPAGIGRPEIQVGLYWTSVVGNYTKCTVSTNVRATLSTHLLP